MTEKRTCQNCKLEFQIEPEDFAFYEKMKVPAPTVCPECRMVRRMVWMNHHALYRRKCDLCQQEGISMFSPDFKGIAYCSKCWWSDQWDARDYGQDYDFSKPFFQQWHELMLRTPQRSLIVHYPTLEKSEYVNHAAYLKNCYLVVSTDTNENCAYGTSINNSNDTIDSTFSVSCESCYECFDCTHCFKTFYSERCQGCRDVWFSKNCIDCADCIGCINLKHKQYHIFNIPYSRDEFEKKKSELNLSSYKALRQLREQAYAFFQQHPHRYYHGIHNDSVSGDAIGHSKNAHNCFRVFAGEDIKHCQILLQKATKQSYDYTIWGQNAELIYESIEVGNGVYNVRFSVSSDTGLRDSSYTLNCISSSNLFGCTSLRNASYCILNKQYSKKEYEGMISKIIEQMNELPYVDAQKRTYGYGEFFPIELSPFSYNETIAQEYFPLTRDTAVKIGCRWHEHERRIKECSRTAEELVDTIATVPDTITKEVISCVHEEKCNDQCTGAFKITTLELEFYRRMNLPLPRLCPNCRHYARIINRNPMRLWYRTCMKDGCTNEFETTYAPDRPEVIYCETCYQQDII